MKMTVDDCIEELNEHADLLRNAATELCKYQIFNANYEARLKADKIAMLTEIQLEIEESCICTYEVNKLIQEKINELKAESEEKL